MPQVVDFTSCVRRFARRRFCLELRGAFHTLTLRDAHHGIMVFRTRDVRAVFRRVMAPVTFVCCRMVEVGVVWPKPASHRRLCEAAAFLDNQAVVMQVSTHRIKMVGTPTVATEGHGKKNSRPWRPGRVGNNACTLTAPVQVSW